MISAHQRSGGFTVVGFSEKVEIVANFGRR